jgi:predicted DNA-binding transcriptional regulator YafY
MRELAAALLATGDARDRRAEVEISDIEAMVEAFGQQLDIVERRQLAYAIEHQLPVTITYTSSTGGTTTRTISDIEMVNGLMYAWCHLREDERVFAVDRVQAVQPVRA